MLLSFEKSKTGRASDYLPDISGLEKYEDQLPASYRRKNPPRLADLAETDVSRHYTTLEDQTFGINDGFYPLGSCTMKYNPKVNDKIASIPQFSGLHPSQKESTVQGALAVYKLLDMLLAEITGMDHMSFQPMAGAQGEFAALLMMKHYHHHRGEKNRVEIIIPDSAHGTNPASATMAGYKVVSVPSDAHGCIDVDKLRDYVNENTAGLMLTNPNTLGIFDPHIKEITEIIHGAGGLNYYDGANLNAILGLARPGDMGFDLVHLNLHKTFSTPHGGGGPGSGPIGCKAHLYDFLPQEQVGIVGEQHAIQSGTKLYEALLRGEDLTFAWENPPNSSGRVGTFHGNFLVSLRALAYILRLGKSGLADVGKQAVLNANYMQTNLEDILPPYFQRTCMHEFVISLGKLKAETSVSAKDFAKALQDYNMHPPTMYFPLNVPEALMIEPTETESKQGLDEAIRAFREIYELAYSDPDYVKASPHKQYISQANETEAARNPILRYDFPEETSAL